MNIQRTVKYLKVFLLFSPLLVFAHPKGEKTLNGDVAFHRDGNTLTINQGSDKAIIHWDDFSIGNDEITKFSMPSSLSSVLNRVMSKSPSNIYGSLQSNGIVFLINQNGIMIGPKGMIKSAGFIASTLDIANEDFLNGKNLKFTSNSPSELIHKGSIESSGDVFFISRKIADEGKTYASNFHLLAGEEILLFKEGEKTAVIVSGKGSIDQKGTIEAISTDLRANGGDVFSLAINQEGIIHATGIEEKDGQIILSSEKGIIKVKGDLSAKTNEKGGCIHILGEYIQLLDEANIDVGADVSGGTILIGGDYRGENPEVNNARAVFVSPNVNICADANKDGDGGKIILWANELNQFYGNISAKGGKENGDGGFVEISSQGIFEPNGKVTTEAANGKTGTVLFDPRDLIIDNNPNSNLSAGILPVPPPAQADPFTVTFIGDNPNIYVAALTDALAVNNIIIDVSGAGAGTGIVTISNPISWSAPTELKIITPRNIIVNANMRNLYPSGSFDAFDLQANTAGITTGTFIGIDFNGTGITTVNGNIKLNGTGGDGTTNTQGISINGGTITTQKGNITLVGNAQNTSRWHGIRIENATVSTTGTGTIHMTGNGGGSWSAFSDRPYGIYVLGTSQINSTAINGGAITLVGNASSLGSEMMAGVVLEAGQINTIDGPLMITGTGGGTAASGNNYCHGIDISGGASGDFYIYSTGTAPITLHGTGGPGGGQNFGITISYDVAVTPLINSVHGDITLRGICTAQFGTYSYGVYLEAGSTIESTDDAAIIINGIGGNGTSYNYGFGIEGGSRLLTKDGPIIINAQGKGTGGSNHGMHLNGDIESTGKGLITITTKGASSSGNSNYGILLTGTHHIHSLGTGDITVITEGGGTGLNERGFVSSGTCNIQSFNGGSINITSIGSPNGGGGSDGLYMTSTTYISSVNGTISIQGIGGGTNGDGIYLSGGRIYSTQPSASIDITGIGAGTGQGIWVNTGSIGNATNTGPITLNTDSISLIANPSVQTTGAYGSVTIQPITPPISINLGDPGATLDLTTSAINQITTGTPGLIVGRADGTHTIRVQNLIPLPSFPSLLLRGERITFNDDINIGTSSLTALIGPVGAGYFHFNNTANLTPNTVQLIGGNIAVSNSFYGSNSVNNWNVLENNSGTFTTDTGFTVNFTNVGSLIGANQSDIFTFVNQKILQGYVDGGAPAMGNYLVYSDWSPPSIVAFTGPYNGWASNLDSGFFNIENAFGYGDTRQILAALSTQMSLSYLYLNPSRRDDVFTNLQRYLLVNYLTERNIFWCQIDAEIIHETFRTGEHINPQTNFEIVVPNFKRYGHINYNYFLAP